MNKSKSHSIATAAMIAALYVILTYLASLFGLASSSIQVRFSEALCILPVFMPSAIPGLFVGCFISNMISGCLIPDIIFGSIATLIGALGTYLLRKKPILSLLPPIIANTAIIPFVLMYAYGIRPIWFSMITVCIGEIISCGILGMLLYSALKRYRNLI